jgi:hypothetical protein
MDVQGADVVARDAIVRSLVVGAASLPAKTASIS